MKTMTWLAPAAAVTAGVAATPAWAQPVLIADSGDSSWVLVASVLVLVAALPGVVLAYGRARVSATGAAVLTSAALATLLFVAIGYSLTFGEGSAVLGGASNVLLADLLPVRDGATISEGVFATFELAVALFTVGILVACVSDKARPGWLLPFSGLWLLLVYVPVARWVWSGWLADLSASDFGGGLVVQTTAGVGALVVAFMLRSRSRGDIEVESHVPLVGTALIWVASLALLGGKIYGAGDDAAAVMLNAQVAAAAAVLVGLAIARWRRGIVSPMSAVSASLAGIAAVSAGADAVGIGGAILVGALGAIAWGAASAFVARAGLGSAAAAFPIHAAPAMAGAVLFPLFVPILGGAGFAQGAGLLTSLAAQMVAVLAVVLWSIVATAIAALMVSMVVPMRQEAPQD